MEFSSVLKMQIKNAITKVLNVPGNLSRSSLNGGKVIQMMQKSGGTYKNRPLEIAIVLDMAVPKETLTDTVKQLSMCIKGHSELFRNVRVNLLYWHGDNKIDDGITALPVLMMGRVLSEEEVEENHKEKQMQFLLEKLRKFYARTKIVFLVTNQQYQVADVLYAKQLLQPFLGKKMISIVVSEGEVRCESFRI